MVDEMELNAHQLSEALSQWWRDKIDGDLFSQDDIDYLFESVFPTDKL